MEKQLWKPVEFDAKKVIVDTSSFDDVMQQWLDIRANFMRNEESYSAFLEQLNRRQAIETGIIERLYTLDRGITENLIEAGFDERYIGHGNSNIPEYQVIDHLNDHRFALECVFAFVKQERELSIGFVKELHAIVTATQEVYYVWDDGIRRAVPMPHGEFKTTPNNPTRPDGTKPQYCPPALTEAQMLDMVDIFNHGMNDAHVLLKSAWLHHAFTTIHPFADGNGRVARLLASLVLIQGYLLPFALDRADRDTYLDALAVADEGEFQPFVDCIMADQEKSIRRALLDFAAIALAERVNNPDLQAKLVSENRAKINQIILETTKRVCARIQEIVPLAIEISQAVHTDVIIRKENRYICTIRFQQNEKDGVKAVIHESFFYAQYKAEKLAQNIRYSLLDVQESLSQQIIDSIESSVTQALKIITTAMLF